MKIDMHVHTIYSFHPLWRHDCYSRPEQVIKQAVRRGLGGLAVTDHDTISGSRAAARAAKTINKDFFILPAAEIRSLEGDILGYGINEEIPRKLTPEETIERINSQGGFAVIAHPFPNHFYGMLINKKTWTAERVANLFREFGQGKLGIETFNSGNPKEGDNRALTLAGKLGARITAGSDSHILPSVGMAGLELEGDPLTAVMKGRAKVWGRHIPFSYKPRMYWIKWWNLFRKTNME
jgi:hypothetical protein